MFCEANGYGLEVVPMSFGAILPAVMSGKCDFASCTIAITPERAESVQFGVPNAKTGCVIVVRKSDAESEAAPDFSSLAGKRIAVTTGTTHPQIALDNVPTAKLVYFDNLTDTFTALKLGKVEAICTSIPIAKMVMAEDDSFAFFGEQLTHVECAPIFAKTEAGRKLCDQFSEFLKAQWDNGTIQEMDSLWFGSDESKRVIKDYSHLPSPNGILRMAAETSMPPFIYVKDNRITGYDVDTAVRFCEACGYGLEIVPMNFAGVIPAVVSGKCDFGLCGITRTPEREESVLFSYPNCMGGNAFVVRKSDTQSQVAAVRGEYNSLADLAGKKVGVETGALAAQLVAEQIPTAQIEYFQALTDALIALKLGKIDALASTVLAARHMMNENEELTYLDEWLRTADIMPVFTPSDRGRKIREEYSSFIKGLWDDGTIDRLYELWLGKDESKKVIIDYSSLPATNGVIRIAVDTAMPPLAYVRDGVVVGYDVDLAARFCEAPRSYTDKHCGNDCGGAVGKVRHIPVHELH